MWNTQFAQCVFNSLWHSITIFSVQCYQHRNEWTRVETNAHVLIQNNWIDTKSVVFSLFFSIYLALSDSYFCLLLVSHVSICVVYSTFFLEFVVIVSMAGKTISIYYMCEFVIEFAVPLFSAICFILCFKWNFSLKKIIAMHFQTFGSVLNWLIMSQKWNKITHFYIIFFEYFFFELYLFNFFFSH